MAASEDAASRGDGAGDGDRLMARIAACDTAAFRLVVERHALAVRRIGYRMLGDIGEAEDVTQECLARLWVHAGRWQGGGPGIAAWLHRVAVNLCLDRLRRRRPSEGAAIPERTDPAPLADAQLAEAARKAQVAACVAQLTDRQRAAIVLTYYEELPNAMAAEALEMNIKAFESLLHRARRTLRLLLEQAGIVAASPEHDQ